jgi:lipopolysaccharide export system protein LptA
MTRYIRYLGSAGAVLAVLAAAGWAAAAQTGGHAAPASQGTQTVVNPLGFSQNSDQPIRITSTSLEVRDKDHIATFIGNVHVVQGESTLRCKTLVVFYDQPGDAEAAPAAPKAGQAKTARAAAPKAGQTTSGNQQIKRLEAKGNVVVTQKDQATQKDQTATGDNGVFDMKTNTATLTGNVVVTQGDNVIRGEKMIIDMVTGVSRIESGKGRVDALIKPNSPPSTGPGSAPSGAKEAKPSAPLKIN